MESSATGLSRLRDYVGEQDLQARAQEYYSEAAPQVPPTEAENKVPAYWAGKLSDLPPNPVAEKPKHVPDYTSPWIDKFSKTIKGVGWELEVPPPPKRVAGAGGGMAALETAGAVVSLGAGRGRAATQTSPSEPSEESVVSPRPETSSRSAGETSTDENPALSSLSGPKNTSIYAQGEKILNTNIDPNDPKKWYKTKRFRDDAVQTKAKLDLEAMGWGISVRQEQLSADHDLSDEARGGYSDDEKQAQMDHNKLWGSVRTWIGQHGAEAETSEQIWKEKKAAGLREKDLPPGAALVRNKEENPPVAGVVGTKEVRERQDKAGMVQFENVDEVWQKEQQKKLEKKLANQKRAEEREALEEERRKRPPLYQGRDLARAAKAVDGQEAAKISVDDSEQDFVAAKLGRGSSSQNSNKSERKEKKPRRGLNGEEDLDIVTRTVKELRAGKTLEQIEKEERETLFAREDKGEPKDQADPETQKAETPLSANPLSKPSSSSFPKGTKIGHADSETPAPAMEDTTAPTSSLEQTARTLLRSDIFSSAPLDEEDELEDASLLSEDEEESSKNRVVVLDIPFAVRQVGEKRAAALGQKLQETGETSINTMKKILENVQSVIDADEVLSAAGIRVSSVQTLSNPIILPSADPEVRSRIPFRGRSHFSLATGWVVGP